MIIYCNSKNKGVKTWHELYICYTDWFFLPDQKYDVIFSFPQPKGKSRWNSFHKLHVGTWYDTRSQVPERNSVASKLNYR